MFTVHAKTQTQRFQVPPFEERFRKDPFSCRIKGVDGRPNRRYKVAFSHISGVVWLIGLKVMF